MDQIITWLHNPFVVLGAYAAFNLLVDTMPEPKADGGNGYLWLYKVLHAAAQNWKTARGLKMMIPQDAPPLTAGEIVARKKAASLSGREID